MIFHRPKAPTIAMTKDGVSQESHVIVPYPLNRFIWCCTASLHPSPPLKGPDQVVPEPTEIAEAGVAWWLFSCIAGHCWAREIDGGDGGIAMVLICFDIILRVEMALICFNTWLNAELDLLGLTLQYWALRWWMQGLMSWAMAIHIHPYSLVNGEPHEAPRHFIIKKHGFMFEKLGLFDGVNEHVRIEFRPEKRVANSKWTTCWGWWWVWNQWF